MLAFLGILRYPQEKTGQPEVPQDKGLRPVLFGLRREESSGACSGPAFTGGLAAGLLTPGQPKRSAQVFGVLFLIFNFYKSLFEQNS